MAETASTSLSSLVLALAFAARKHRDQRRKDVEGSPYINHPIALLEVLVNVGGVTDTTVLSAALLHDALEDTETTMEEIVLAFGPEIAQIVSEVSDDKSLPRLERKRLQIERAPELSNAAKLVKLADKICNLKDIVVSPPKGWSMERRREYFDWAKLVIDGLRGTNPPLEALFDEVCSNKP